ncbi:membrane bound O-acyl transferase family-domain-containing protein [Lentinula edodes]|uniref:membrane bound O-acyl transferase family-domain-containing protein n=1 Tax=Lentinula edodes TaxID=5353 RepID=UPI001E8CEFA3|nr:membrane bound O-acyl transferase family-domain-containing protein [Lentinula edodes]KAH7870920.1 membrane bound O-acyl transferase family-domain-containing protein [Lentinula edodes]
MLNSTATKSASAVPIRQSFSIGPYLILPDLILAAILALGLKFQFRVLFFALFSYVCISGVLCTTGDRMQDYSIGSTLGGQFFTAAHLLLFAEPLAHYRHCADKDDPRNKTLWRRMLWSLCIVHSPRGIGWNYQVSNVPPRPLSTSKWTFIRSRLVQIIRFYLIMDLAQSYIHMNSLFTDPPPNATITSQGWLLQIISGAAWMTTPYAGMSMQYLIFAVFSVGLGFSSPEDWPDTFGTWKHAYTVRNFWGKFWHQMIRRYVTSIGKFVCRQLGFQPGTWLSSYTQLYIAFFVSAILHCFGDVMVGWEYLGASFPFFISQAFGITLEDIVIDVVRRLGLRVTPVFAKFIGYMWVVFWMSFSLPWYIDWAVNAKLGQSEVLPVSPVRYVLRALSLL